jgi:thioredoxin reductase
MVGAAVFIASRCSSRSGHSIVRSTSRGRRRITLLHRRAGLRETMSDYLIRDLERYGVAIRDRSEIAELHGADGELEAVTLRSGERLAFSFLFVFLFLGVLPRTD